MAISTSGVSVPQLGQTIDASIYGSQNAPKPMTISDMLDISGKSLDIQKKKALLPSEIESGQAQAKKATTEANKAQFGFTSEQGAAAQNEAARLLIDPRIKNAENTPEGREKALRALDEVSETLKFKGLHNDVIKGMLGQYYTQAIHDPTQISPKITQGLLAASGTQNQTNFNYPSATSVAGIPGYENRLQQTFSPISVNQQTNQQTQTGGGNQTNGSQNPQAVVAPQQIVQETFPNRSNTPYVSETEKPKFDEGVKLITEGKQIGDAAQTQLNDIRNARKYIKSATGTALGQGTRNLAKLVAENPDLDSLIKSTAQLQMNAATRFGASTDAARETAAAAAGGADISEKALVRILDNAEADLTRDAKYSAGLQKFVQKRGNTGGTLNAADFKQAWINNAKDRKLYQLININANPELSTAQKQIMRDELLYHENPSTITALEKQLKAMKQLEKGD